jgi:hypothetical protein
MYGVFPCYKGDKMKSQSLLFKAINKFVELPDSVKAGIIAVVVFVFGWVFAQIVVLVPF